MAARSKVESGSAAAFPRHEIEAQVRRIIASPAFSSSERAREFLTYVIGKALDEDSQVLHERTVANELFQLPHYDPAVDSFVRVKAGDVRKRLAKYYELPSPDDSIRIQIPLGVYLPKFSPLEPGPVEMPDEAAVEPPTEPLTNRLSWLRIAAVLAAVAAFGVVAFLSMPSGSNRPAPIVQAFWEPLLAADRPLLVSLPSPGSFMLYGETLADFNAGKLRPTENLAKDLDAYTIPQAKLVRQHIFFGIGEAQALVKMSVALDRMNKSFVTKAAMDVSSSDLHNQNAVLLGGFSSRWTLRVTQDLPFRLEYRPNRPSVVEVRGPKRVWESSGWAPGGRDGIDYAIVARLKDWNTGQAIMLLAGPQTFGSQAAMEFALNPEALREMAAQAPPDWRNKNIEVVIQTRVIEGVPSPGRIVATHFW